MKRWFLRIQISHFLRFAMSLAKLMIAVSLPLVRVILQGCGGEEEEATTVAQNATTNIVTNCDVSSAGHCGTRNSCDHQCCRHWCRSHSLAVVEVLFDTSQWGMRAIYAERLWQVGRHFSPRKMKKTAQSIGKLNGVTTDIGEQQDFASGAYANRICY